MDAAEDAAEDERLKQQARLEAERLAGEMAAAEREKEKEGIARDGFWTEYDQKMEKSQGRSNSSIKRRVSISMEVLQHVFLHANDLL